jgi:hypothetical protein
MLKDGNEDYAPSPCSRPVNGIIKNLLQGQDCAVVPSINKINYFRLWTCHPLC